MLSKSQAKAFFLFGTAVCSIVFVALTVDTFRKIPAQTNSEELSKMVIKGKHLFEQNNCMGCHTLFGEGAYYAPELTKVYERRGEAFIHAMLTDPQKMYPGERKMTKYDFSEEDKKSLIAFFRWVGRVDLNGFPPKPDLDRTAVPNATGQSENEEMLARIESRPKIFNQMCVACHQLGGQGGNAGPALDGVGSRRSAEYIKNWLKDPISMKADSKMPKLPLSESDVVELTAFLSQLKEVKVQK